MTFQIVDFFSKYENKMIPKYGAMPSNAYSLVPKAL